MFFLIKSMIQKTLKNTPNKFKHSPFLLKNKSNVKFILNNTILNLLAIWEAKQSHLLGLCGLHSTLKDSLGTLTRPPLKS